MPAEKARIYCVTC